MLRKPIEELPRIAGAFAQRRRVGMMAIAARCLAGLRLQFDI
jgi:hypothetical protein